MVAVRTYVEGASKAKSLKIRCRKAFSDLFREAGFENRMPKVLPCGGRNEAFENFCIAIRSPEEFVPLLLVDSEGPMSGSDPWAHLRNGDGWERPEPATEDQCHLMVQVMES